MIKDRECKENKLGGYSNFEEQNNVKTLIL